MSCTSQSKFCFCSVGPSCLCLCVAQRIGAVAGWGPVSTSLSTIITAVAACTAILFFTIFMLSGSSILACVLYNSLYLGVFTSAYF